MQLCSNKASVKLIRVDHGIERHSFSKHLKFNLDDCGYMTDNERERERRAKQEMAAISMALVRRKSVAAPTIMSLLATNHDTVTVAVHIYSRIGMLCGDAVPGNGPCTV